MVDIQVIDGQIKFIRTLNDSVLVFNCQSIQNALSCKAMWEAGMLN